MEDKGHRNVVYSCKDRVVWCPKLRRPVLVNGMDERLKEILNDDFLAAGNIRDEGLRLLAAGQAGEARRSESRCKTRAIGLSASN